MTSSDLAEVQILAEMLRKRFPEYVWDDSVEDTARRFLKYLDEYIPQTEMPFKFTTFEYTGNGQIVIVSGIEFSSICAHHLLPFSGTCDIGYIPNKLMAGLSKFPRVVDWHAARPNTQELLADSIADHIKRHLDCLGVAVVMRAAHTCMSCRGVRKVGTLTTNSVMKGVFLTNPAARQEFFSLLGSQK